MRSGLYRTVQSNKEEDETTKSKAVCPVTFLTTMWSSFVNGNHCCWQWWGRETDAPSSKCTWLGRKIQTMTEDKQCLQRDTTEGRCLEEEAGRTCLMFMWSHGMMSTRQWSRPETSVCWHSNVPTKVCCARTLFKAKFLFRLMLNTLPAEPETYNALVVMVCSGERSTRSTQRIMERDTAQTERTLTRLVITSRPDSRSVSNNWEKKHNSTTCFVEPRVTHTLSVVPEPTLRAITPFFSSQSHLF